jgi:integrase
MSAIDLSRVSARARLQPRAEPYWQRLEPNRFLGVRVGAKGQTWVAKSYDPATQKKQAQTLGEFADLSPSDRYAAAKTAAEALFAKEGRALRADPTVKEVAASYAKSITDIIKREEVEGRFARTLKGDPIETMKLSELEPRHLVAWRAKVATGKAPATVNREQAVLRAALNWAHRQGLADSDRAWRGSLQTIRGANRTRDIYLDRDERVRLLEAVKACDPPMEPFFRCLCLLPLRVGAVAALKVGDLDKRLATLRIMKDKAGAGRTIPLSAAALKHLTTAAGTRNKVAHMFVDEQGHGFQRQRWHDTVKYAAKEAGLPKETVAYSLRHSTLTDMLVAGADPLTTARLAGTSIDMLSRTYGHLLSGRAVEALDGLAL